MPKELDLSKWKKCKGCKKYAVVRACKDPSKPNFGKCFYFCPKDQGEQCDGFIGVAPKDFLDADKPDDEEEPKKTTTKKKTVSKKRKEPEPEEETEESEAEGGLSEDEKREKTKVKKAKKEKLVKQEKALDPIYTQNEMGKQVDAIHKYIVNDFTPIPTEILDKITTLHTKIDNLIEKLEKSIEPKE